VEVVALMDFRVPFKLTLVNNLRDLQNPSVLNNLRYLDEVGAGEFINLELCRIKILSPFFQTSKPVLASTISFNLNQP
jgi:hypothetical protein